MCCPWTTGQDIRQVEGHPETPSCGRNAAAWPGTVPQRPHLGCRSCIKQPLPLRQANLQFLKRGKYGRLIPSRRLPDTCTCKQGTPFCSHITGQRCQCRVQGLGFEWHAAGSHLRRHAHPETNAIQQHHVCPVGVGSSGPQSCGCFVDEMHLQGMTEAMTGASKASRSWERDQQPAQDGSCRQACCSISGVPEEIGVCQAAAPIQVRPAPARHIQHG